MKICYACKQPIESAKIGRRDECPRCKADLYCCLNCEFHDRTASKQCREPIAELVKEKQKANYCDHFRFKQSSPASSQSSVSQSRKELEDLFKR